MDSFALASEKHFSSVPALVVVEVWENSHLTDAERLDDLRGGIAL